LGAFGIICQAFNGQFNRSAARVLEETMLLTPKRLCLYPTKEIFLFVLVLLIIYCLSLSACSTSPPINKPQGEALNAASAPADDPKAMTGQQQKARDVESLNEKLMAQAQTQVDPGDALLGPGDLLHVEVFEAEELNAKARISSRGYVTLPLLGQLEVDGLTAREAETHIEDLYRKKYIKDPHVSIFVEEHFSQRVTLVGQFNSPGTYDLVSRQRLLDVMALGGGVTEKAGRIIQVRRRGIVPGPAGEMPKEGVIYVDMDKLIREGMTELNIQINGGDVVFVAEAGDFFVDGAVRRPGSYPLNQRTTVQEAIVAAGGMAPYADEVVSLVRVEGGERKERTLDMDKMENWGFPVQDQDVIVVGSNPLLRIWHGFSFGFMGTGFRDPAH
jgi:polysaccharide biosynthesis/export protein